MLSAEARDILRGAVDILAGRYQSETLLLPGPPRIYMVDAEHQNVLEHPQAHVSYGDSTDEFDDSDHPLVVSVGFVPQGIRQLHDSHLIHFRSKDPRHNGERTEEYLARVFGSNNSLYYASLVTALESGKLTVVGHTARQKAMRQFLKKGVPRFMTDKPVIIANDEFAGPVVDQPALYDTDFAQAIAIEIARISEDI